MKRAISGAGRLHALAVTTATRMKALPDVPTVSDFVPGYEASNINGVGVPAKTPPEIIAKLNTEINDVLAGSRAKERMVQLGGAVIIGSPDDFGTFLAKKTEKWAQVVKSAGLKPG